MKLCMPVEYLSKLLILKLLKMLNIKNAIMFDIRDIFNFDIYRYLVESVKPEMINWNRQESIPNYDAKMIFIFKRFLYNIKNIDTWEASQTPS